MPSYVKGPIVERPCRQCGATIQTTDPRKLHCNRQCKSKWQRAQRQGIERAPMSAETRAKIGAATARRRAAPKMHPKASRSVKLSPERAAELAAGRGGTMPPNRRRDAQSGSVYSRMTQEEQRAFRKWLERENADNRSLEGRARSAAGLGQTEDVRAT